MNGWDLALIGLLFGFLFVGSYLRFGARAPSPTEYYDAASDVLTMTAREMIARARDTAAYSV